MMRNHIGAGILAVVSFVAVGTGEARAQSYTDIVKADNPLLYWNFNEAGPTANAIEQMTANVADELAAQGGATRIAGTTTTGGLGLGNAASFNGANLTRFRAANLSPTTNLAQWAMEFWIQNTDTTNNPSNDYVFEASLEAGNLNNPSLLYNYVPTSGEKLELFSGGQRTGEGGPTLPLTGWHHVVIGYYGSGAGDGLDDRQDFYVDGVLAATTTHAAFARFGVGQFSIGNSIFQNGIDPFSGNMDEVAIYDLSQIGSTSEVTAQLAEIAAHYSAVPEPAAAGLACVGLLAAAARRRRRA